MNCNLIKQKIDQLVFEKDSLLTDEVANHIESCDSCQSYLNERMAANRMVDLLKMDPKLNDPTELTNSILSIIDDDDQIHIPTKKTNHQKIIVIIRRTLAAASVSLMLIFGIEQYIVFDKTLKLENSTSKISNENKNISFKQMVQFNTGMQIDFYKQLFKADSDIPNLRKIKTRLMLARLSSITVSEIDKQNIRQLHRAYTTLKSN